MIRIATAILFSGVIAVGTPPAEAFSLKKALKKVKKVVKQVPKVARSIPNPINTQIDILTGKTKPKNIIKNEGQRLQNLSSHVRKIDNAVHTQIANAGQAIGGDFGRIVVEFSTGAQRLQKEFLLTATNTVGLTLQGQDPLLAVAVPLAAAIRDARNKYHAQAKPLPADFKRLLAPVVPPAILNRARYTVDNLKIALPALINSGQKMFGNDHAVVVDDIIVFSKRPDPNKSNDIFWVAHEVHHVYQYMTWGVDRFALNYLRNHGRVEAEADQAATRVHGLVMRAGGSVSAPPTVRSARMVSHVRTVSTPLGPTRIVTQQKLSASAFGPKLSSRCIVNGEEIFIQKNGDILSPMRFNAVVGQQLQPRYPQCAFEMKSAKSFYCVLRTNGAVLMPGRQFPVGRCQPCNAGNC